MTTDTTTEEEMRVKKMTGSLTAQIEAGLQPVFQNKHNKRMVYLCGTWMSDTGTVFFKGKPCPQRDDEGNTLAESNVYLYKEKLRAHWVYLHYSYTDKPPGGIAVGETEEE